jgi:hypothetical protein
LFKDPVPLTDATSVAELFAFLASSAVWRFNVGRSGSSAGAVSVVEAVSVGALSEVRRFIEGRSGSSAGVDVLLVVVDEESEGAESGVWRFMVGRSGSSAGVEPASVGVFDAVVDVPEDEESGLRRFIVGRSESALVEVLVVLDVVVVSDLLLGWSLPLEDAVSPAGFEPK